MRDPKRIEPMLNLIRNLWHKAPDLRLFQLLLNAVPSDNMAYYMEDEELVEALKFTYKDQQGEEGSN